MVLSVLTRIQSHHLMRKIGIVLSILILLIIGRHLYLYHTGDIKELMVWMKGNFGWKSALLAGLVYIFLLAIPFFPGIELAWLVIMLFGKPAVVMIYLLTIVGFGLSFAAGRWFTNSWLLSGFDLQSLIIRFNERTEKITRKISELLPPVVIQHKARISCLNPRYLVLAVLINLPGNAIIGGGGGIALLCGINRSFSWKGFMLTVSLAVSPLPLLLYFGLIQIETLMVK
ncbi:MAG: hypothetical protein ABIK68_18185 [bacterium]